MMAQFAASALSMIRSAVAARSFSASDLPMPTPWACRKVLAMPPPITRASTLRTRFSRRSILVETLAPPMIAITGLVGASSALPSASSSACMVRAGKGGRFWAEAVGRGVGAVRRRERVVDPDVAEFCQFSDEGRIVLLFLFVEAGVFQAQDV